jgi:phage shock protein PspC (stress-responsive transcriptional regulator)/predicted membrane protein
MEIDAPPSPPPPPPPPPPPRVPPRGLHRNRANGILGGVCAGVAETYGWDVTLVRVAWVVAAVLWVGVPAYVVAWIALPRFDGPGDPERHRRDPGVLAGLVLVAIGVIIASNHLLPHGLHFDTFGAPLLLIGGGLAILFFRSAPQAAAPDDTTPATAALPPAAAAMAPAGPPSAPEAADEVPTIEAPTIPAPTPPPSDLVGATTEPVFVPPSAWTQTAQWPASSARAQRRAARHERRAQRPRPFLTPLTLSVLLIGAGVAYLLQATGALEVNLTVALAIGTCVVGAALVVSAFAGRAPALIAVGIVLLAATAIANTIDVPLRGGIGERVYRPQTVAEVQPHYEHGIGRLVIDLRDVPLARQETDVSAQLGIGQLLVQVPSSVRVEVTAHAGAGSLMLFGREHGGWPANDTRTVFGTGSGVLRLDLRVGAGQVRVQRFEPDGFETILGGN